MEGDPGFQIVIDLNIFSVINLGVNLFQVWLLYRIIGMLRDFE